MFGIKKMLKNRKAQVGTMELVISVAIGLIVLAAIYSLAPVIGDKIDSSVELSNNSSWAGDDVPTGVDIWKDNATLISLVVLVMIISLAIFYIRRMGGGGGGM
jgi:uncharacterized protein (UPF0333 family)